MDSPSCAIRGLALDPAGKTCSIIGSTAIPARRDPRAIDGHVPVLGPAHIADRIVVSLELVLGIVTARPVRAGSQEVDLLGVDVAERFSSQPDVADQHHPRLLPAPRLEGLRDDFIAAGALRLSTMTASAPTPAVSARTRGTYSDSAGSSPCSMPYVAAWASRCGSGSMPITVQPDAASNCTVSCPRMPRPTTNTVSPSTSAPPPHPLHGDRTQRHRAGHPKVGTSAGMCTARLANTVSAHGVIGDASAGAGDAVADPEIVDARADLDHLPRNVVAGGAARRELAAHPGDRAGQPLIAHHLHHLPHALGLA